MQETKIYKPSMLNLISTIASIGFFSIIIGLNMSMINPTLNIIIALIAITLIFIAYLALKMTTYEVQLDGLLIKKGIIAKKQILLLYSQIQDVTEYQDIFGKIVGLKALQIETMTVTSAVAGRLSSLTVEDANAMKLQILQIINAKSKKNNSRTKSSINVTSSYNINEEQNDSSKNPFTINFHKIGFIILFLWIIVGITTLWITSTFLLEKNTHIIVWIMMILIAAIHYFIQQITFKYWIGKNSVTIKSGLLSTQKTNMEYSKIQDFIVIKNIFEKLLGLASIRLETGSVKEVFSLSTSRNNKQQPNYTIGALKLIDVKKVVNIFLQNMYISYVSSNNPLVKQIPLNPKKIIKKTISGIIGLIIVCGIILGITTFLIFNESIPQNSFSAVLQWTIISGIILAILTPIYQKIYFDTYYYDISKNTISIKKGVLYEQQIYLPFEKIQNVFRDQDLLDRMLGLYDIHVSTVGKGSIALCHIDGLTKENADKMLIVLLRQVKENNN